MQDENAEDAPVIINNSIVETSELPPFMDEELRQHRVISCKRKAITNSKKNRKVHPNLLAKATFIKPSEIFCQPDKGLPMQT